MHRPRCSTKPPNTLRSMVPRVRAGSMTIRDTAPPDAGPPGPGLPDTALPGTLLSIMVWSGTGLSDTGPSSTAAVLHRAGRILGGGGDPDAHRARSPVVPLEVRDGDGAHRQVGAWLVAWLA